MNTFYAPLFVLISTLSLCFSSYQVAAQQIAIATTDEIQRMKATEQEAVVDSICQLLMSDYVFPDKAVKMQDLLHKNLRAGHYKALADPQAFAKRLTEDLFSIAKDKHLRVTFSPERINEMRARQGTGHDAETAQARQLREMSRNNFGFKEIKILRGNVGYLDLRGFVDAQYAGETAVAAMNFLANTDALIIDLRQNGGGSPSMIQMLTSYLYPQGETIHLNNFYWRPDDITTQTWTLPHVQGKRMPDAKVYVLTSGYTFSAAEEFTYNLKNLERATIVGETTGGGAHPGGSRIATDRFMVWIPSGRAINPITNTNWEGTGVQPHIEAKAADALLTAHIHALETMAKESNEKERKVQLDWAVAPLKAQLSPVQLSKKTMESYVGKYESRMITIENGELMYQREGRSKHALVALTDELFIIPEIDYFRLKVLKENGKVVGLMGLYDNGHTDRSMRNNIP